MSFILPRLQLYSRARVVSDLPSLWAWIMQARCKGESSALGFRGLFSGLHGPAMAFENIEGEDGAVVDALLDDELDA